MEISTPQDLHKRCSLAQDFYARNVGKDGKLAIMNALYRAKLTNIRYELYNFRWHSKNLEAD